MSKVIKVIQSQEIAQMAEDKQLPSLLRNAVQILIDNYANAILQNEDIRAVHKMLHSTNIESITWGAVDSFGLDTGYDYAWSFPLVKLSDGTEFEVDEDGIKEEHLELLQGDKVDLEYIQDFLNNDVLSCLYSFGDLAHVEITAQKISVDSGAIYDGEYSDSFMKYVALIMRGQA